MKTNPYVQGGKFEWLSFKITGQLGSISGEQIGVFDTGVKEFEERSYKADEMSICYK